MALMDILQTVVILTVGIAIIYYIFKLTGLDKFIIRVLSGRKKTKEERLQELRLKYKRIKNESQ